MDSKAHWEEIHGESGPDEVSWYLPRPAASLRFIEKSGIGRDGRIIDVGCGQSGIVGALLAEGFTDLTGLDVSGAALRKARALLGPGARRVDWIEADVLAFDPSEPFDLWHDRAVFHFLTQEADQRRYRETLHRSLRPGGSAVVATFSPEGPDACSGLPVARYEPDGIAKALHLELLRGERETHTTPWGVAQAFAWALLRKPARG